MFRSRPIHPRQAIKMAAVAAVSVCIAIPVVGGIVEAALTGPKTELEETQVIQIAVVAMLSPILTLPVFFLAGPLAAAAWTYGIGGWASALTAEMIAGVTVVVSVAGLSEFVDVGMQGVVLGSIFGMLTWATGQIARPRA